MNTELKVDRDSYVQYPLSSIFPDRGNPSLKVVNNHGISHLLMGYPQLCTYIIIYIYIRMYVMAYKAVIKSQFSEGAMNEVCIDFESTPYIDDPILYIEVQI